MYHETLTATFGQPKLIATNANHEHVHDVVVKFECDLSDSVAAGIGIGAKAMRKALIDGEAKSAKFDLSAVACNLDTHVGEKKHVFKNARGVRVTAKIRQATKDEDEGTPRAVFEFQLPWNDNDLLALGHSFGRQGAVRIEKMQLSLMDGEEVKPKVRKKAK